MIPNVITTGTTLDFNEERSDYPASEGWALRYVLLRQTGRLDLISAPEGEAHRFTVSAADTAAWLAGDYRWQCFAEKDDQRHALKDGSLTVKLGFAVADGGLDTRSHVKKVLDAIEAVLEKRATKDQMSYTIEGRTLERTPIVDLLNLRDKYRAEYQREQSIERYGADLTRRPTRIRTRFIDP